MLNKVIIKVQQEMTPDIDIGYTFNIDKFKARYKF